MAQSSYSFLDVAALEDVRTRFASGDALVILSTDLADVIWANGPGAALFGHDDVETILGAQAPLGPAARRQISALRGFPAIGRDRPLLVRITLGMSSDALRFLASAVTLPDGEAAILLAQPAVAERQAEALAAAIGGFSQPGHFLALVDGAGKVEAASPGFARLRLTDEALAALAADGNDDVRVVKRMIPSPRGPLPAGLGRLTESRNLVVVVVENWANEQDESLDETPDMLVEPQREVWHLGSEAFAPADEDDDDAEGDLAAVEPSVAKVEEVPASIEEVEAEEVAAEHQDEVDEEDEDEPAPDAALVPAETLAADEPNVADEPAPPTARPTGPVRFVWRTDAQGRFSQLSTEFVEAVGKPAADIIGRSFQDVAKAFGLDPTGEVAGLLEQRDTWSGRTVSWPIAETDLRAPVDLAALPVYDRNRDFQGFRGFGVARIADAAIDPAGTGLALPLIPLTETSPAAEQATAGNLQEAPAQPDVPVADATSSATGERAEEEDQFRGETPALSVTPVPDRRQSDKIIRLAEHRSPAPAREADPSNEKGLSAGERIAFQQIGERLRRESRKGKPDGTANVTASPTDEEAAPKAEAGSATDTPLTGQDDMPAIAEAMPEANGLPEPEPAEHDNENVAELRALDGADSDDRVDATTGSTEDAAPAPASPEAAVPVETKQVRSRPGMSLLDFTKEKTEEPAAPAGESEPDQPISSEAHEAEAPSAEGGAEEPLVEAGVVAGEDAQPAGETPSDPDAVLMETSLEDDGTVFAETDFEPIEPATEKALEASEKGAAQDVARAKADAGLSILEKLPVPVLVHSGDTLHYANDEFFALTGYASTDELAEAGGIGALFVDSYEDEQDQDARGKSDRHMRLTTKAGQEFPVEAFLQSIPWENGKALVLVLSRIRDGAGAGQSPLIAELEARVAEMRTIIDTATDGVVLISSEGNIRSISRPAEALFGADSDEVAGKPFSSLFAIESQKAARDYLAGLTEHGVASVLNDGREVIGREAEGRFIPLFMTLGKLPGDSGFCAVVRDITQWKRAEEELTQARSTAERASSHKSEFLARVSHEIRTPLNAIIGFSELMLDEKFGPVANDRYRDYLRDINRSGNHVLDLVNDLLDISKIEAGQQDMSYEAVSLNEALAETVALMQPQANRERVIIRSSFASKLPDVVADLRSVRQIALNILSNAVRYTQAGGQVIVSTAYESHGEVVMRVRDTGIGMTPGEIEQALKPFKQINSLQRRRGDGTGLGLPLTKAMVEANRAKFSIHSTPGEGTMVEIAFPSTRVLAE
ncbi:MAG: PAS domain S-box protein [Rhizobiaceae bacterium]|nr:PAS domain S-box protein [Rhizobiaceae bacterium]